MKKKRNAPEPSVPPSPAWIMVVPVLCAGILLAHFIAGFFPHRQVWGINHLAYFPFSIRLTFILLLSLVFIPQINKRIRTWVNRPITYLYERSVKHKKYLWYGAFSLLSAPLFWGLRAKTYLLGDGFNYVSNLNKGVATFIWSELLESRMHVWWYKLLNLFFSVDGQLSYQTASIIAGILFVFLLFWFSDQMGSSLFEKLFVFSILATMGSIQLFLGYVEHYSFACLSVLAYLFFALRFLDQKGKLLWVVLFFVLSLALHFASFYLLPSLAYLLLLDKDGRITRKRIWSLGAAMVLLVGLFSLYIWETKPGLMRIFVLPVEQKFAPGYTLFSSAHLMDILNESLLVSPVGIVLLLVSLLLFKNEIDLKKSPAIFLLVVTVPQFLLLFFLDPGLGAARDWDLFSVFSLGYTILGLWLFLKTTTKLSAFKYIATILVFTSFASTLPWIALNASESKSVQRFRDILDLDPKRSRSGHFFLAQYFDERGMAREVEEENRKQKEIYPELALLEEAVKYYNQGKLKEALDVLKQANRMNPYLPDVHYFLGRTYYRQGILDLAENEYKKAVELKPEEVKAHIDLAKIYASKGSLEDAVNQYKKVLKLGVKDPGVYSDLGKIYFYQNQIDKALKHFQRATEIQPDFVDAHLGLGAVFFKLGRLDDAQAEYQKVVRLKPDSENAYLLLSELYLKKGLKGKAIESLERFLEFSSDPRKSEEVRKTIKSLKEQK